MKAYSLILFDLTRFGIGALLLTGMLRGWFVNWPAVYVISLICVPILFSMGGSDTSNTSGTTNDYGSARSDYANWESSHQSSYSCNTNHGPGRLDAGDPDAGGY